MLRAKTVLFMLAGAPLLASPPAGAPAPEPFNAARLQGEKAVYYYCPRASAILHFSIKPAREKLPKYCSGTRSYSSRPPCILVRQSRCLKGKCPVRLGPNSDPRMLKFDPPETWTFGYQVASEQLYVMWLPGDTKPHLTTTLGAPIDRIAFREHCLNPRAIASP